MSLTAERLSSIASDIRGKNFWAALDLEKQGHKILKLNTGNPAAFGFKTPESVKEALVKNLHRPYQELNHTKNKGNSFNQPQQPNRCFIFK